MESKIKYSLECLALAEKIPQEQYKLKALNRHKNNLISHATLYLNNSEAMQKNIEIFEPTKKQKIMAKIEKNQKALLVMGISLETYRKFMTTVIQVVHKYYARGFLFFLKLDVDLDIAELAIHFDNITPQQAFELNSEIDDAILSKTLNDNIFADEVRKITTYCTLVNKEELAEGSLFL